METKNNTKYIIIFWVVMAILLAFIGWYFFFQKSNDTQTPEQTATNTTATTTGQTQATSEGTIPAGSIEIAPGVFVTPAQPQKISQSAPSLDRDIPDTSKLDSGIVVQMKSQMQVTITNLKNNKTSFQDWINLGFQRKTLGDYQGAVEAWEYVSLLYPQNSIAFGNLGDLYANFLHDTVKAEGAYGVGIVNNPSALDLYRNLFNLYISEHKNTEAVAILKAGIAKNPNTFDLQILLARYYRDAGNSASAKIYYDQAISLANKQGNVSIAEALTIEESQMK